MTRFGTFILCLAVGVLLLAPIVGCSGGKVENWFRSTPSTTQPTPPGMTPPPPKIDAGSTMKMGRVLSPFGISPGNVVKSYGGGKMSYADGVFRQETEANKLTIWDIIKERVGMILWLLGGGGALLAVLWLIPATRPIAALVGTALGSLVPVLGSWLQKLKGDRVLTDTVQTVQDARKALASQGSTKALEVVDNWLDGQSAETKAVVAKLKAAAGIASVTDPAG